MYIRRTLNIMLGRGHGINTKEYWTEILEIYMQNGLKLTYKKNTQTYKIK